MKKKAVIICVAAALTVVLGVSIPAYITYSKVNQWNNLIYPGVKIQNIDVSGKTKAEAKNDIMSKLQNPIASKKINIKLDSKVYSIDYSKLDAKYDIDTTLEQALNYGKNSTIWERYKLIKNPVTKNMDLKFSYNSKPLDDLIANIKKDVNKNPSNAKITKSGSGFTITEDIPGRKLNEEALKKDITSTINGDIRTDTNVQANAETTKAAVTKEKLQGVNTLIASFDTDYASISGPERMNNIQLATKAINGTLVMPGDSFSFNDVVGQRTAAKGYQAAPVIIGNKVDSGLGGGICQVSTSLYNAMLRTGVKATERSHHTLPSHYVTVGLDATVDYGNLDYKFKNTLNFPIYIEGLTQNGHVTFNIYSDSSLTSKTYKVSTEEYETMQPKTTYVDDPTLPAGTTVVDQNPSVGHKVKVYLETYQGGNLVNKEQIGNDVYNAVDEVIKRGTKK
ncbi:MAG: VanW family protein [Bacillota bacterium]|nr:VanW family protein [Bacillota bacterium]